MAWAKTPIAIGAAACAACLALATTSPVTAPIAEKIVKAPITSNVNLAAINFANLDLLSAIPAIQALINDGDTSGLDSLNGIAAFLLLGDQGLAAFEESETSPGYAALSGLNSYATGNLAGIDAFSALGATGLGDLDSVNGIPAFQQFFATGDLHSFDQTDEQPGYAALSALGTYQDIAGGDFSTIGNLDSLSAIPSYRTLLSGNATPGEIGDALRGLDAFSAIPEYLGLPTVEDETPPEDPDGGDPPATLTRAEKRQLKTPVVEQQDPDQGQGTTALAAVAAPVGPVGPAAGEDTAPKNTKKASANKQNEVRDSGKFTPKPIVLFGSGSGKNAADNGMRGYGDMLKKLGLNGGDTAGADAGNAPAKGGDADGGAK
jgi:hypothetical protein